MRTAIVTIYIIVLTALFLIVFAIIKKVYYKQTVKESIQYMPDFRFKKEDGSVFYIDSIGRYGNSIINHFNPACDHCQYMAEEISKKPQLFANTSLFMISSADSGTINQFKTKYKLTDFRNIIFLNDDKNEFSKLFGTAVIPSFFVYDKNKKLIKNIIGETKIENLVNN